MSTKSDLKDIRTDLILELQEDTGGNFIIDALDQGVFLHEIQKSFCDYLAGDFTSLDETYCIMDKALHKEFKRRLDIEVERAEEPTTTYTMQGGVDYDY